MTRIKICGITHLHEALQAHYYGAWAIGQIFASSKRQIDVEAAARMNRKLGKRVMKVGVFVNEKVDVIKEIAMECSLDMIQLHGEETPEYARDLPYPVIKSFHVAGNLNPEDINRWNCWAYLFDTYDPNEKGGTGRSFNWAFLKEAHFSRPIILAGGINANNVIQAISTIRPMAIDLSSGLENADGGKNPIKIKKFMEQVKEADRNVS